MWKSISNPIQHKQFLIQFPNPCLWKTGVKIWSIAQEVTPQNTYLLSQDSKKYCIAYLVYTHQIPSKNIIALTNVNYIILFEN